MLDECEERKLKAQERMAVYDRQPLRVKRLLQQVNISPLFIKDMDEEQAVHAILGYMFRYNLDIV